MRNFRTLLSRVCVDRDARVSRKTSYVNGVQGREKRLTGSKLAEPNQPVLNFKPQFKPRLTGWFVVIGIERKLD